MNEGNDYVAVEDIELAVKGDREAMLRILDFCELTLKHEVTNTAARWGEQLPKDDYEEVMQECRLLIMKAVRDYKLD